MMISKVSLAFARMRADCAQKVKRMLLETGKGFETWTEAIAAKKRYQRR
ncbi:hypothetical protein ACFLXO_03685 [Chloroflexota bacterium]